MENTNTRIGSQPPPAVQSFDFENFESYDDTVIETYKNMTLKVGILFASGDRDDSVRIEKYSDFGPVQGSRLILTGFAQLAIIALHAGARRLRLDYLAGRNWGVIISGTSEGTRHYDLTNEEGSLNVALQGPNTSCISFFSDDEYGNFHIDNIQIDYD